VTPRSFSSESRRTSVYFLARGIQKMSHLFPVLPPPHARPEAFPTSHPPPLYIHRSRDAADAWVPCGGCSIALETMTATLNPPSWQKGHALAPRVAHLWPPPTDRRPLCDGPPDEFLSRADCQECKGCGRRLGICHPFLVRFRRSEMEFHKWGPR